MKKENYDKVMAYLDIIEAELDKVAKALGHPSYEEFFAKKESTLPLLEKAA